MNSETATEMLSIIAKKEEGSFPKEIAEEVGVHVSTASEIIRQMRDLGFIKRAKRGQAQYYEVDYTGIADFWFNEVKELYPNQEKFEIYDNSVTAENEPFTESEEIEAKKFFELYIRKIFERGIKDKISNIMFESLYLSLEDYKKSKHESFFWSLDKVEKALSEKFIYGSAPDIIEEVVEEMGLE